MNKKEIAKLVDSIYDICEKKGIKTQVELIVNEGGSIVTVSWSNDDQE